jgi:hypothetical protein
MYKIGKYRRYLLVSKFKQINTWISSDFLITAFHKILLIMYNFMFLANHKIVLIISKPISTNMNLLKLVFCIQAGILR